jgi:hypothetical protein
MVDFSVQMPAVAVTFMLMLGVASAQALASERILREVPAGQEETSPEKSRKRRRRRRGSTGRPIYADESVTPPPEFDLPWTRRGGATTGLQRDLATPAPQVPLVQDRASAPPPDILPRRETPVVPVEAVAAVSDGESYKAALARWQSLRQATAAPDHVPAPTTPDLPTPRDVWIALGRTPPDDPARLTLEDRPPIVDATAPQPPMPPAWPGEARRPGGEPTPPDDDPDNPPDNVVHLTRSRRP